MTDEQQNQADTSTSEWWSPLTGANHPERIGPFKILQVLGEGGMGIVYEAEQTEPVRRRVALKIIKAGMDTKEVVARFEAERQALAVMDHPNIAKVLDAGATETGRPYFVMELVHGVKLTEYCDAEQLSVRDRLELFVYVCQAIQHAHQKGVIHRDLKPSNVLVTERDGVPTPTVIDFGVAKAMGYQLTEKTLVTTYGTAIGTPAYMSPEQAEMSQLDVDTRTDIYSLGVMLYELLVGRLPLDPTEMGLPAFIAKLILRDTAHPTPSGHLSKAGTQIQLIAKLRAVDPSTLRRELRGDLDWIVTKAMEKDRKRRYETANGFALDIQRHLNDEPVLARSPNTTYRLGKFVRRNKVGVTAGVLVAASIVAGLGLASVGLVRARRAEAETALEAEAARQVSDFLVRLFEVSNPSEALGNSITAREILDVGAAQIRDELTDQPVVQARLMGTMGYVYRSLGLYEEGRPLLEQALALQERELGPEHPEVARSLKNLANLHRAVGNFDQAEPPLLRALAIEEAAYGPNHPDVAETVSGIATLHWAQAQYADAQPLFERSVAIMEEVFGQDHREVALGLSNLGGLLLSQRKLDEAEPHLRRALTIREKVLDPNDPDLAITLNNLGALYQLQDNLAEAAPLYERATVIFEQTLGPEHPTTASGLNNLGEVYWALGRFDEAEPYLMRALTIKEQVFTPDHPSTANTLQALANLWRDQGRHEDAEATYRRALAMRERVLDSTAPEIAETLNDYARLLRTMGRTAEADQLEARAQRITTTN
jgi:serine/threonine protein kinase/tetratricopeptide (TPR) repeat protein